MPLCCSVQLLSDFPQALLEEAPSSALHFCSPFPCLVITFGSADDWQLFQDALTQLLVIDHTLHLITVLHQFN